MLIDLSRAPRALTRRARRLPLGALSALACAAGGAQAQSTSAPGAPVAATPSTATAATRSPTLPDVVVTGNPLGSDAVALPASTLSGDALTLRRASTLGETLDGLPGVSSSWFGPNANRPVIRGQDGDRIRVLGNGGASLDASSLSNDHAVPIDPLAVTRLEVIRGPAALLYGGSAVGGVVNAIDNRIPRSPIDGPTGAAELRVGGAAQERSGSVLLETGQNGMAVHLDAFRRRTDDLRVPDYDRPIEGGGSERQNRVLNSASDAKGAALGLSRTWDDGYVGASIDTYRNVYGTVAEEDVTIRMHRDRLALGGEWRALQLGPITTVRAQLAGTDYEHIEMEGAEEGTVFHNRGVDGRVEAEHRTVDLAGGRLRGVFGVQNENSRFSALGEERFVPDTHTRQLAGFVFEEWQRAAWTFNAGLRHEGVQVSSRGDAPFFDDERSFAPTSAALGAVWAVAPAWKLTANLASTERAPTFYELYADGEHVATAAYERGNRFLGLERGRNLDLAAEWSDGPNRARVGVYESRFRNYIALLNDGQAVQNGLPLYVYTAVPARLRGVEAEGRWRAWSGSSTLDLDGKLDLTRATQTDTGAPLPRIAPLRVTLGATWTRGPWQLGGEVVRAQRQDRVPDGDTPTPGYTLVNANASWRVDWGSTDALWFLKLGNLGNTLAYNAATVATVLPLSPLPGRSIEAGLRVTF